MISIQNCDVTKFLKKIQILNYTKLSGFASTLLSEDFSEGTTVNYSRVYAYKSELTGKNKTYST